MAGKGTRGFVYAIVNPQYPHLVKIGCTESSSGDVDDLKKRVKEISTHAGVPDNFIAIHAVRVDNHENAEKSLHSMFRQARHNPNREFFKIGLDQIQLATDRWEKKITKGVKAYISQGVKKFEKIKDTQFALSESERSSYKAPKVQAARRKRTVSDSLPLPSSGKRKVRPNLSMQQLQIPNGAKLTYKGDVSIIAIVSGDKVKYQGKIMALSKAAQIAGQTKSAPSGSIWWKYKGEALEDRRNRMESSSKARVTRKPSLSKPQSSGDNRRIRQKLSMQSLQIPDGAELTFKGNVSIKAIVAGDVVSYKGEIMSLSKAAQIVRKSKLTPSGSIWWEYKGESLEDRRNRMESGSKGGVASKPMHGIIEK